MSSKQEMIQTLSNSIVHADQLSIAHPKVMRHEMYAKSLRILHDELKDLPDNHQIFVILEGADLRF